jgi:hypothetical protein
LLYVSGNVYISGNITAGIPVVPNGATNAVYYTPSFMLVATGNIYVDNDVTGLYGSFAAQPATITTGGDFYTCASGQGAPFNLTAANYGSCTAQLVVTGGIAAKKLHLLRTGGTMSGDQDGGQTIGSNGSGYQSAAEVVIYNPVLWLRRMTGNTSTGSTNTGYDAMTTLPPVL